MGRIFLNDLHFSAIIGTLPQERNCRQSLTLDAILETDMRQAAQTDALTDAVDYSAVEQEIGRIVEKSSFFLLEALLGAVGSAVSRFPGVTHAKVRIAKPGASRFGASCAVEAEFRNGEMLP